ncbi:MAG TPA: TetR/AcrR family transcriptional regulator [Crocinitomix sp.]|nr:TetR/AcrR family transcriptional regulator [Crocinitomix sp.]
MENKKVDFLSRALEVYMRFGIKSVTMDELARQLGISKKTIYTFVKDKNDLVTQCVKLEQEIVNSGIQKIANDEKNAIDELFKVGELVAQRLRSVHPSIFFDMQRYHPEAYEIMNESRRELIRVNITANLKKGKEQGYYRDDINEDIISKMYIALIDVLFNGDVFPISEYSFIEVYSESFNYHMRGIASSNGLKYLEKIMKNKIFNI